MLINTGSQNLILIVIIIAIVLILISFILKKNNDKKQKKESDKLENGDKLIVETSSTKISSGDIEEN